MRTGTPEGAVQDDELDEVLRGLGGTRLYRNNVFRLTALPVTASPTQIRRRREEAALLAQLGTPPAASDELPLAPAPDWDAVDAAFESLRSPVLRLVHELLWPWGAEDDHDSAVRRHCAVLEGEPLTGPEVPGDPLGQRWLAAVEAWAQVLSGERIWDRARQRVREIDDPRLTTGTVRRLRDRLPRHLVDVHLALAAAAAEELGGDAADRHLRVLDDSSFDDDLVDAALRDAVRPAEERVRAACETADRIAETAPRDAAEAGHALLERTAAPLRTIAGLLSADHPVTTAAHDEVARSVNLCAVAHHNDSGACDPALDLLRSARELARERTAIELIDQNTAVLGGKEILGEVDELCAAGKVDAAADRLRAWRGRTDDEALRRRIDAVLADQALRTPPNGMPFQGSVFGWGAYLYGARATTEPGTYVTTHYLTALFIPVFPMAAYLRDADYLYGKVPLSRAARWWRLVAALLLALALVQPFPSAPRLLVFLAVVAGGAAVLGLRRYRLTAWAAARVDT
ncbi:hypothetical protein [Saccharopolyspora cebuensis]|uniref:Uncharacterized protein n=1 Tax=Saccharopolyspora cebuensis TaxID=418759 RepID=A0ABV4CF51_9PSEU